MSAWRASAGPLTTHPMTAIVIGTLSRAMCASTAFTVGTMSYSSLPHVGQATSVALSFRMASVFRISCATRTSSRGSDVAPDAAGLHRARLRDTEVNGIGTRRCELPIRHDVGPDVGRLQRHLDE